jgi:GalNAc-alpha-(1->4)-GalNAc-alpha-(1->3)-diNAcBac-PP-undecaprenol alpha-1,4-N-acetyl-D-galactosaminyltransferase
MKLIKKKVCLAIPSLQPGGMERVMSELTTYFCAKQEFEVHILLYGRNRDIFYPIPNNVIIHRPDFIFNNSKRTRHTLKTLWFLRQVIRNVKPDTVLSFGEIWNNFVLIATLGLKFPIFISDRCQPDKQWSPVQEILRKNLYTRAAGVICQTETAQKIYQKIFQNKNFHVIGNPIRNIQVHADTKKENVILSVGRLINTKHFDELIKIFAYLNPPNWQLIIVGDDALKQQNKVKLETLIRSLEMENKILLAGNRADVDDFYKKAKIFTFTSSSEGFPNVIGEAMSAGLPVVSYDCIAGPSDLIDHGKTGFLVPLNDLQQFAFYLEMLIKEEQLRMEMGNRGKEKIKQFSIDVIGLKFQQVILN